MKVPAKAKVSIHTRAPNTDLWCHTIGPKEALKQQWQTACSCAASIQGEAEDTGCSEVVHAHNQLMTLTQTYTISQVAWFMLKEDRLPVRTIDHMIE